MNNSIYDDRQTIANIVRQGSHREVIGGMWDEIGRLQASYLIEQGLKPHHSLLDVGCGCLRAGVHFVDYLDADNYFGYDINSTLLEAGYTRELDDRLRSKLPRENLRCIEDFEASVFQQQFDFAVAQSVFTHMPIDLVSRCFERTADVLAPGASLYATFFEQGPEEPDDASICHHGGVVSHRNRDPFHVRFSELVGCSHALTPLYVGEWNHPRGQRMVRFLRPS